MKIKKKAAAAAAVFAAAMNFSACDNYNGDVYGPPTETWAQEETDTEAVSNDDATPSESESETSPDNSETTEGDEQQ